MLQRAYPETMQTLHGIRFSSPIGLAAGFDYEAKLTRILPSLGFGFQTVGTITHGAYIGNEPPRLGRLVGSRSLMVNKGFKNPGITSVLRSLQHQAFPGPVGISLGQTNSPSIRTPAEATEDILTSFRAVEHSSVPLSYYELNISCPNLGATFTWFDPELLDNLLRRLDAEQLSRPLWIKMPISVTDEVFDALVQQAASHAVAGIIVGNLQKDRTDPAFVAGETKRYPRGNFSGMPTQRRSDELIRRAYRVTNGTLSIIGCGGVFTGKDAYRKIRSGASLIQLITGLIFEGPQLASTLNDELVTLMRQDGFSHISEAVGVDAA